MPSALLNVPHYKQEFHYSCVAACSAPGPSRKPGKHQGVVAIRVKQALVLRREDDFDPRGGNAGAGVPGVGKLDGQRVASHLDHVPRAARGVLSGKLRQQLGLQATLYLRRHLESVIRFEFVAKSYGFARRPARISCCIALVCVLFRYGPPSTDQRLGTDRVQRLSSAAKTKRHGPDEDSATHKPPHGRNPPPKVSLL